MSKTSTSPQVCPGAAAPEDIRDYQTKHRAGGKALSSIMKPIREYVLIARILVIASCIVALAPYVALTRLGAILLGDHVDHEALTRTANVLWMAFCLQALLYVLALVITHIADIKLRNILQDRIIDRISKAPLAWFSSSSTGRVRKAIQDDTVQIHMLVAHAPVEQTAAVGVPLVLLVYAFVVDWRLGFLSIATFPIYALLQWVTMRDMATKTAEMDDKLADRADGGDPRRQERRTDRQGPSSLHPCVRGVRPVLLGLVWPAHQGVGPVSVGDLGGSSHGDQSKIRSTHGQGRLGGRHRRPHLFTHRPGPAAHHRGTGQHGMRLPTGRQRGSASAGRAVHRADQPSTGQRADS